MKGSAEDIFIKVLEYKSKDWYDDIKKQPVFEKFVKEIKDEIKPTILELVKMTEDTASKQAKKIDVENQTWQGALHKQKTRLITVIDALLSKNLKYTEKEWLALMQSIHNAIGISLTFSHFPLIKVVKQLENHLKKNEPSSTLINFIKELLLAEEFIDYSNTYSGQNIGKFAQRLLKAISNQDDFRFVFHHEEFRGLAQKLIEESSAYQNPALHKLLMLIDDATSANPKKSFEEEIPKLIDEVGKENFRKIAHGILEFIANQNLYEKLSIEGYGSYEHTGIKDYYLSTPSKQFAKGLIWSCASFSDKTTIFLIGKILEKSFMKIPSFGPYASSVGNACVYTLGNMRGKDGLGALSRGRLKMKQNGVKKLIDKYLEAGAKKYNVSVEELKEMATPDFGMDQGAKAIGFGDYELKVFLEGSKVKQQWYKPDGSAMKSVPSIVKKEVKLTAKLKEIRKEIKDIQKVYSAQKQRIDNLFILDRTWNYESFEKYYLLHGLVAPIAKQLIWTIMKGEKRVEAIAIDDTWKDVKGNTIDWVDDTCTIKLWHPVFANETEITNWRSRIIDLECKQPIKQAFREIYIVTDAELNTVSYSNRMAAHILKQHQFSTLAKLRDWRYSLMGAYDDGRENETCYRILPEHDIVAQFWIDELPDYDNDAYNDAGIWYHITTDQVKFKKENGELVEMKDVPKLVFSEIMRDVDLFVGVASVGNDPEWQDNGGDRRHQTYWQSYSFGNLSELAKTRKSILEHLLPKLKKLKGKAKIDGKFLIVQGSVRTYKIHIGSGNILMEPNDQYLCIVPDRNPEKKTEKLFIPFEGDKVLSIVLSKAFLLVEDEKITDTTILSQINR